MPLSGTAGTWFIGGKPTGMDTQILNARAISVFRLGSHVRGLAMRTHCEPGG
jgi:hypothetical protein